ncbi:hypothetical protein SAMN06297468_1691 [Altererythrobacter xiamenensis]|uniref:Uncharacterized protein n=1 Tax=Altererythrobacter xiamenensis TaxID=1316679 RepID=A0A1Y6F3P8_9SPHN|nr:hypothetical protein [Altererythrobacter xiamenensis]SMQ69504.1 hypothetical protein SAMN06297468_1691 [Altererythrobacter xiamenensis]
MTFAVSKGHWDKRSEGEIENTDQRPMRFRYLGVSIPFSVSNGLLALDEQKVAIIVRNDFLPIATDGCGMIAE